MKKFAFSLIETSLVILIIGILVGFVTQGSRMVRESRIATARQLTKASPVTIIPGLAIWLDATAKYAVATGTSTYTDVDDPSNNTAIGRWNDVNPVTTNIGKIHFTQSTSANQPVYKFASINNLPTLDFDGSTDCLSVASFKLENITTTTNGNNNITLFFVERMTGTSSTNSSIWSWDNGLIDRLIVFSPWSGSMLFDSGNYTDTRISYSTPSTYYNTAQILTLRRGGTGSDMWLNGTSVATTSSAGSNFSTTVSQNLEIGGCTTVFRGSIGEVIVFNRALTNDEKQLVEEYLSKKWAIKLN